MFKWKKPYVMLIFGESTWALDDFHSQRSSPSTDMLRQLPGKCGGSLFQTLSTWAAFAASGLAYQVCNGQVSVLGVRRVDTKGQLEFNASSGHPVWLLTGGEKLASSKQVLGLNLNLYFWALFVETRIWNWDSGSQLSSVKIFVVRLGQIQTKVGGTRDNLWDS